MKPIDKMGMGPERREEAHPDGTFTIFVKPPDWIGDYPEKSVRLTADQYTRYRQWRSAQILIQDALPELSGEEREILMNGDPDE